LNHLVITATNNSPVCFTKRTYGGKDEGTIINTLKHNTMEIYISEEDILRNIQNKFHEVYHYLKLECYLCPHERGEGTANSKKIPGGTPIEEIRLIHSFGWLDIGEHRTVAEVERDFYRDMGLAVQIFRRSRTGWLQTTRTDELSLGEQNLMGKESLTAETEREAPIQSAD
jgi:hypothetical protein